MNLVLKSGKTYISRYGYVHSDFVAYIEDIVIRPSDKMFSAIVSLYKSQEDKDASTPSEGAKTYDVDGTQYNTVMSAIENQIRTNSMTFEQALYTLLLTRPLWANWELKL